MSSTFVIELPDGAELKIRKLGSSQKTVCGQADDSIQRAEYELRHVFPKHPWFNGYVEPGCYQARINSAQWDEHQGKRRIRLELTLENGRRLVNCLNYTNPSNPHVDVRLGHLCKETGWTASEVKDNPDLLKDLNLVVRVGDNSGYTDVLAFNP